MKILLNLALLLVLATTTLTAQTYTGIEAARMIENAGKVILDTDGTVQYCAFEKPLPFNDKTIDHIKQLLRFDANLGLEEINSQKDKLGFTNVKYSQTYYNIPIEGAVLSLQVKNGQVTAFSGDYQLNIQLPVSTGITEAEAIAIAREVVKSDSYRDPAKPQQVIYPTKPGFVFAYKVDVFGLSPLTRKYVIVDAQTGAVIHTQERIHHAEGEAETRYSGTRTITTQATGSGYYRLHDDTRGDGITTMDMNGLTNYSMAMQITDSDNYWEQENHNADAALDAHWGTAVTYDYFLNVHDRDSYNGQGAAIFSYVDFDMSFSNAFWNGEAMTYGAGGNGDNPFPALEVVAHEIVHGLTEHSAGLVYQYESGALNESFSDIFGIAIDFHARGDAYANYELGEAVTTPPIRSMSNPNLYECPDTYEGDFWIHGDFDNGGVHYNSGVQNFWFYLLAEGGTGTNDKGDTYFVDAIGLEAAANIAFRNLTVYLTPWSEYSDARTLSILAAADLYGECSDEVIAVTNAWHAVGVGEAFNEAVIAYMDYSNTFYCQTPATLHFSSLSTNAATWLWTFGDGNTSTEENPSHTYAAVGEYTVTLQVTGEALCSDSDTIEMINLITITNEGGPASATCAPSPISPNGFSGISYFHLADISNTSGPALEGYEDFSCTHSTLLSEGTMQTLTAETFNHAFLHVWLDLNADGTFAPDEKIYTSPTATNFHTANFVVPEAIIPDEPLRLRIISSDVASTESCNVGIFGQTEDYSITMLENEAPPVAGFDADQTVLTEESVLFNDLSLNVPASWLWTFEGGIPETSTQQFPTVQYNEEGLYDVSLIATNEFGADTLSMSDYITVASNIFMCSETSTTAGWGTFYDSGGPTGNYGNGEFCTLLISPACAESITLSFQQFQLEGCCDYFEVFDGSDATSPLLMSENGGGLPSDVTAESGQMFIRFSSDGSYTYSGWEATWSSQMPDEDPEAEFTVSDSNPPLGHPVQFTDATTEFPFSWQWNFGDGTTSNLQNPVHAYNSPGAYEVTLAVGNCYGTDTLTTEITVQQAAEYEQLPSDVLLLSLPCGASADTSFTFVNNGDGDLVISLPPIAGTGDARVLALTAYTEFGNTYVNTINAINSHFTDYELIESDATSATQLAEDLQDIDILLIPFQDYILVGGFFSTLSPVIIEFLENGGKLLLCGNEFVGNLDIFPPSSTYPSYGQALSVSLLQSPLTNGVSANFSAPYTSYLYLWSNYAEVEPIIIASGYPEYYAAAKMVVGAGEAIYCGFDYMENTANTDRLLANALEYLAGTVDNGYIDLFSLEGQVIIAPGDSLEVPLSINAENLFAGQYSQTLYFETNDPENPLDSLQVQFEVLGQPLMSLTPGSINYGDLIAGFTSIDTVLVFNDGCADLDLNFTLNDTGFELIGESSITIPPFSVDTILVAFAPETVGSYSGQLDISGNDGDDVVMLTGEGLPAPQMEIFPADTLFVTLPCGTVSEEVITIYNNGDSQLEINSNENFDNELHVLALSAYTSEWNEYPSTIAAINTYFDDYYLYEYSGTDLSTLSALIQDTDILLIPEQAGFGSASFLSAISPLVSSFVENGGNLLVCGMQEIQSLGILNAGYVGNTNGVSLTNVMPDHPVMEDIPNQFPAPNVTYYLDLSGDPEAVSLATFSNLTMLAEKQVGLGRMLYIGFDFYANADVHARIMGNAMAYLSSFTNQGVTVDTEFPLFADPSASIEIPVVISTHAFLAGEYFTELILETNDPDNSTVNYVIAVEVTGNPVPELSTQSIEFPLVYSGQSMSDSILIYNEGCEVLTVEATLPDGFFSISATDLTVAPYSSDTIVVTYAPLQSGSHSEVLELATNAGEFSVDLSASSATGPVMVVSPENLVETATACADSVLVTFEVSNTGEALLEFTIGGDNLLTLDEILGNLNASHTDITDLIPNIFLFNGGESGSSISDGGGDMYDSGNYLTTNYLSSMPYTGGDPVQSYAFGTNSTYFTRKVPGLFVLAADMNDVSFFRITGNLGADGQGTNNGGDFNFTAGSRDYKGFYTSTSSTGDPTINHIIIVEDGPDLQHQFQTYTGNENHYLGGINGMNRIYYLLFAGNSAYPMPTASIQAVFETFVSDFVHSGTVVDEMSYQVNGGNSVQVEIYLPVAGLNAGTHEFDIHIVSNVPGNPLLTVPVSIEIDDTPCSFFAALTEEYSCDGAIQFENHSTNSPQSYSWDFGDGNTSTEANPLHIYSAPGTYTVTLTVCTDGECDNSQQTVEIVTIGGPTPAVCQPVVTAPSGADLYFLQASINDNTMTNFPHQGYVDNTCEVFAQIGVGEENEFQIIYFDDYTSRVRAQIDFNNDGGFSPSETIFDGSGDAMSSFTTPPGTVLNQSLRFRMMIDYYSEDNCLFYTGRIVDLSIVAVPVLQAPQTAFSWVALDECQRVYQFIDNSVNVPTSWNWNFGDGHTSSIQNPIHTYDEPGGFIVSLTAGNIYGTDTENELIYPPAGGILTLQAGGNPMVGETISFTTIFDGSGDLIWDFGDGSDPQPGPNITEHVYTEPGVYEVIVTTTADVCNSQAGLILNIQTVGLDDNAPDNSFLIYPNPSRGDLTIECTGPEKITDITLYDAIGKKIDITTGPFNTELINLRINDPVAGMYFLQLTHTNGAVFRSRVIMEP